MDDEMELVSGLDYVGADDPLELLGVSGEDYVGDDDDDDDDVSGDVGDDDDDEDVAGEIGAILRRTARRPVKRSAAATKKIARGVKKLAARNKLLRKKATMGKRAAAAVAGSLPQVFLGVPATAVNAGAAAAINGQSGTLLRITDFIVDDDIAGDFQINTMQVGRINLLASGDPIPASMFRNGVQRPPIEVPKLHPGQQIALNVTNISGAARTFRACFIGSDLSLTVSK